MDAERSILTILLLTLPVPGLQSSDSYLPTVGPAPLRFATAVESTPFTWPIPLNPVPKTNPVTAASSFGAIGNTNPATTLAEPPSTSTNAAAAQLLLAATNPPASPQIGSYSDGNLLSASNLLVLTPQMLADYFKASLDGFIRLSTNGPAGPEIPFNPPTPKPSESEAIYRTQ